MLWIDQRKFEGLKLKQCTDWWSYLSLLSVKKVRLITNFSPVSVGFFCQTKILVLFQFNERIHLQNETKRAALLGSFTTWTAKKKKKRISRKRERHFKSNGHFRFRERYKRRPQLPFYRLLMTRKRCDLHQRENPISARSLNVSPTDNSLLRNRYSGRHAMLLPN